MLTLGAPLTTRARTMRTFLVVSALLCCVACPKPGANDPSDDDGNGATDSGPATTLDGGVGDAAPGQPDASSLADAASLPDASVVVDAGSPHDAGSGMATIPAGPFTMGCGSGGVCGEDEGPARTVTLSAFDLDITEVTQAAYAACVQAGSCTEPSDNYAPESQGTYPVVNVSWSQAVAYCAFMSKRLPTEAEWEKAARGTDERTFPWGTESIDCGRANTLDCGGVALPAGVLGNGASPYGALDMAGNVWEWTHDFYDATYYATAPTENPPGPATGTSRVYRGGSFGNLPSLARTTNRADTYSPTVGGSGLGFRCAR